MSAVQTTWAVNVPKVGSGLVLLNRISTKAKHTSNTLFWSLQHSQPSTHGIVGCLNRILRVNLNNLNIRFNTLQWSRKAVVSRLQSGASFLVMISWHKEIESSKYEHRHCCVAFEEGRNIKIYCLRWKYQSCLNDLRKWKDFNLKKTLLKNACYVLPVWSAGLFMTALWVLDFRFDVTAFFLSLHTGYTRTN